MTELPFKCKYCTRMFAAKSSRNNHHHMAHKNKDVLHFKCDECQIYFESKEELRIHSFVHYDGDIKTCHICEQIFKNTRMLNIHLQKHSAKFQCEECLQNFSFKSGLKKHIRLNRCKGPLDQDQELAEMSEKEMQEIAKNQLMEISNNRGKLQQKTEIDIEKNEEICENDDDNFQNDDETEIKNDQKPRLKRPQLTYICDKCGEEIKFRKNLQKHMKDKHTRKNYNCSHCVNTFFKSRRQFKLHALEIHGIKERIAFEKYCCRVCDKKFDIKSIYETHKLSHENIRPQKCDKCNRSFKSVGNLKRHQVTHIEVRNFLCDNCAKSFKSKAALKIHKDSVHADMKIYVNCNFCKAIVQEKNLKTHIFNLHTSQGQVRSFICNFCDKKFKNEFLLKRHSEAVHSNANRGVIYECVDCSLTFNRQRDLRAHSFVHYNGMIHECTECGKKFKNRRLLLIHSAIHASNVTFPCNFCDVSFQTVGGRRKHIRKQHNCNGTLNEEATDDFIEEIPVF